jgi:hypothetical protein
MVKIETLDITVMAHHLSLSVVYARTTEGYQTEIYSREGICL